MASKKTAVVGFGVMVMSATIAGVSLLGLVIGPNHPAVETPNTFATPKPASAPTSTPTANSAPTATESPPTSTIPEGRRYDHVIVVVLENHSFESVSGNRQAPYLNSLASKNAVATGYSGVSHPSLPNYLALTGGSTFGVTSDCTGCFIGAPSVADRVEAAGLTWRAYNESMPSACFGGDAYPYAQKHNPFYYYNSIRQVPSRCSNIVPLTSLSSDFAASASAPAFSFVTPNMCNDGHDCSLTTTDEWLARFVPALMGSAGFEAGRSLLIVTYDEGEGGSDRVLTVFAGTGVKAGFTSGTRYDHYSLLRTIEDSLGLENLGRADQAATSMLEFFRTA